MTGAWSPALVTLAITLSVLIPVSGVVWLIVALRRSWSRRAGASVAAIRTRHPDLAGGHRPIVFAVPTDSVEFLEEVRTSVPAPSATPVFLRRLYLAGHDDGSLTYAVGTRIRTGLTYLIVTASTGSGCVGQAGVARWSDRDGLHAATDDVALIDERVLATIVTLGGSYQLRPGTVGRG